MAFLPIELCCALGEWPEKEYICILLQKPGENLFLPLWITPDRFSVLLEVLSPDSLSLNRPSTFTLLQELSHYLQIPVSEARIDGYDQGVFMASLVLNDGTLIEARALDAVLASRALDISLLIDSDVLHANGIQLSDSDVKRYLNMEPVWSSSPEDTQEQGNSEDVDKFTAFMKNVGVTEEDITPEED